MRLSVLVEQGWYPSYEVVQISILIMAAFVYHLLAVDQYSFSPATWVKIWDWFVHETCNQFGMVLVRSSYMYQKMWGIVRTVQYRLACCFNLRCYCFHLHKFS